MLREELIFVATCDIAGHVRGKGFPARELPSRLRKGIGWTHSNLMMSAFGPIFDTPFGTSGDLMIVPDREAAVRVDFGDGLPPEQFHLGDIRNTDEHAVGVLSARIPAARARRTRAGCRVAAGRRVRA